MIKLFKRKFHNLVSDKKFSEILTGSAWALAARIVATGMAMCTSIVISRRYGADVMGVVALINSFLTLATIFTVLGTSTSILRLIPEHIAKYSVTSAFRVYRKTQYFVAAISVITGGFFFFGSSVIAGKIFSKPQLSFFFALAALFIVFKSLGILNTQAVRGIRLIKTFAFMQMLPSSSNLLMLVLMTLLFFNRYTPVYAMLASSFITAIAGVLIMDRKFKKKMGKADQVQDMPMKDVLSRSLPMLMTATMTFTMGQTGVILLGMFRQEAEVGYYDIAVKLATLTAFVLQAINSMVAPKFSELFHSGNMDELFHIAQKSSKLIFWTTAPILFCLLAFGRIILKVLYGQEFLVVYFTLVLLLCGQFINTLSGSTGFFMNMTGHEVKLRNIISIAAGINILLSLLLIPKLGINGAAIGSIAGTCFWNIYIMLFIKAKYGRAIGYLPRFWKLSFKH